MIFILIMKNRIGLVWKTVWVRARLALPLTPAWL